MNKTEGQWITVHGVHILLESGETKEQAIKRFIENKSQKKDAQIQKSKSEADELNNREREKNMQLDAKKYTTELRKQAMEKDKTVTKELQDVVSQGTGELVGLEYRIKGIDSLEEKLFRKAIEKGITVSDYAKKVTDVLRYTNMSKAENLVNDFNTVVSGLKAKGYEMIEVNNTWKEGSAYKGINILVRDKNGYTFELQFHTKQSMEIKEINHKLYEKARKPGTSQAERDRLELEMARNAQKVITPKNIDQIKDKR